MKNVMVDLETLDSEGTAAITSIGAVFFDLGSNGINGQPASLGPQFKANVRFKSAVQYGTVSGDTLEWWFKQTDEARAHLYTPEPIDLPSALTNFADFLLKNGDRDARNNLGVYVWGNGATFDNVILAHAYKQTKKTLPWGFRYDSCFRTLKNQFDPESKLYTASRVGVAHDSLSDAVSQAQHALAIFNTIRIVSPVAAPVI